MKKLWIVLLSVALIMAFAMPVCAADVKFSGSYIAQGYYDNNRALVKDGGASVSDIWQRLRVQTDFKVQEGLTLTTRFDAMEKIWGAPRTPVLYSASTTNTASGYVTSLTGTTGLDSAGNNQEAENIKFEHVYVSANLFGGLLRVGYQQQTVFGTSFGDSGDSTYGPRIRYDYVVGPWTFIALWDKLEGTQYYSAAGPSGNVNVNTFQVDATAEKYVGAFMYSWSKGNAGLLVYYLNGSNTAGTYPYYGTNTGVYTTDTTSAYKAQYWVFDPYVKAQLGPVYLEAEVVYVTGKLRKNEIAGSAAGDVSKDGLSAYVSATVDFAPMYAGINLVYVAGDDRGTSDKDESGAAGGTDFNPLLMLFNYDLARWNGAYGNTTAGNANGLLSSTAAQAITNFQPANAAQAGGIYNAQIAQVFVGVKPMPKLDIKAAYAVATADKDGSSANWQSRSYGSELDITATYKIYDNLSYMVGFGYLWAGDYYKGTNAGATIDNDYLITHKLTLTF
jgi:hypothetical protein